MIVYMAVSPSNNSTLILSPTFLESQAIKDLTADGVFSIS